MQDWHSMRVDQVLKELNTDPHQGLSAEEVRNRLEKYGYNEVKRGELRQPSFWSLRKKKSIPVMILVILAGLTLLVRIMFGISIHTFFSN